MIAYLSDIAVIGKGMFSNEVIVQYYDSRGKVIEGFFDKQFVKEHGLEVSVLYSNDKRAMIIAPQDGFLEMPKILAVPREDIFYARAA